MSAERLHRRSLARPLSAAEMVAVRADRQMAYSFANVRWLATIDALTAEGPESDEPFDAAEEQERCLAAAHALALGDVYTAAIALYGVQGRATDEFLRRKHAGGVT